MRAQLGQIMDKRCKKTKNPAATSEDLGAKTGCQEQKQFPEHLTPAAGWAGHVSHLFGSDTGCIPNRTPCKELACLSHQAKGNSCLFSLPSAAAGAPVKPCLHFSLAFTSHLVSSQFLLIREGQEPWLVSDVPWF